MSIKDKIFNKMANFMYKYKSEDKDKIQSCSINAVVKGALITSNNELVKSINNKEQEGLIDVDELLNREINNNGMRSIVLCDNGRIACLTNQLGSSYVETSHEFFELANESIYLNCTNQSYNALKEYLKQSSKWCSYVEEKDEIPHKRAFETLFRINTINKEETIINNQELEKKQEIVKEDNLKVETKTNENKIQIDGIVSSSKETFIKKDNTPVKYIDITQEDIYNGKKQKYTITVALENNLLEQFGSEIEVGDKVRITGKLVNSLDKNKTSQSIINSSDFQILERNNQKDVEREDR